MTLMPILDRELRIRARGPANYWIRLCVALAGVLICLQSFESGVFSTPSMMGTFVFNGIVGAAFLVSCCACLLSADAISAEWREGTLGLLFLTRVKVLDVLLGKLGSVGISAFCAVMAFLPILMVPVLAGGITGGEAARKGLALLDGLFLALVVGLFSSAAEHERFRAVRNALVMLILIVLVPFLAYVGWGRGVFLYLGLFSPLVMLVRAGDVAYTSSPKFFWLSFVAVQVASWFFLLRAGRRLMRAVASEGGATGVRFGPSSAKTERAIGLGIWQPVKSEASPVEWLVFRQYGVHAGIWALAVLALACNAWVPIVRQAQGIPSGPFFLAVASPLGTVAGLIGATLVAWVASRFFVGVRRSGDLELLLTTPVGARTVVEDQWKVLKRLFVWPVLCMQAPMLPQFLIGLSDLHTAAGGATRADLPFLRLLTMANAFMGAAALCWLGLWFGLRARTQAGAIVWAAGLGKAAPSLVALLCSIAAAAPIKPAGAPVGAYVFAWWVPELATTLFYLWLIAFARTNLERDLAGKEDTKLLLRVSGQT
jgi:hypothetical protein